jgi:hypothetical protein
MLTATWPSSSIAFSRLCLKIKISLSILLSAIKMFNFPRNNWTPWSRCVRGSREFFSSQENECLKKVHATAPMRQEGQEDREMPQVVQEITLEEREIML